MDKKLCTKCCVIKNADYFRKSKKNKSGLSSWCRECDNAYHRAWASENREKVNGYAAKYYRGNPEKLKEKRRKYYINNAERLKEARSNYIKKNPKKAMDYRNSYFRNNEEKERARVREYQYKKRENLCDSYIKKLISNSTGISMSKIPKQLIDVVRLNIQIKRFIKEAK